MGNNTLFAAACLAIVAAGLATRESAVEPAPESAREGGREEWDGYDVPPREDQLPPPHARREVRPGVYLLRPGDAAGSPAWLAGTEAESDLLAGRTIEARFDERTRALVTAAVLTEGEGREGQPTGDSRRR